MKGIDDSTNSRQRLNIAAIYPSVLGGLVKVALIPQSRLPCTGHPTIRVLSSRAEYFERDFCMPSLQLTISEDPKAPHSRPVESLQDADQWAPSSADIWNISTVLYHSEQNSKNPSRAKLLLCHDMANGMISFDSHFASIEK